MISGSIARFVPVCGWRTIAATVVRHDFPELDHADFCVKKRPSPGRHVPRSQRVHPQLKLAVIGFKFLEQQKRLTSFCHVPTVQNAFTVTGKTRAFKLMLSGQSQPRTRNGQEMVGKCRIPLASASSMAGPQVAFNFMSDSNQQPELLVFKVFYL
jgi:hypothetical protein